MKVFLFILFYSQLALATVTPDWSADARLPEEGNRKNIYGLNEQQLFSWTDKGKLHALVYPVDVSAVVFPYRPLKNMLEADESNPLRRWILENTQRTLGFHSIDGMYKWLGLSQYPEVQGRGVYRVPYPNGVKPTAFMGATVKQTSDGDILTFSCAACHAQTMFGRPIIGLTNKRPRANDFFMMGKKYVPFVPHQIFQLGANPTEGETRIYKRVRKDIRSIGAVAPQNLGLDSSLAQVALSLAHRKQDAWASKSRFYEMFPRQNELKHFVADSKPATWWNVKYKTRWLSDGSVVSGNPIFTNFLWNEIGRGTDMKKLKTWMQENEQTMKELTAAVFATEAPHWSDFFGTRGISIERAKRGEMEFNNRCAKCHGHYEKGWSQPDADSLSDVQLIATTKVRYPRQTRVKDVGTDPQRYLGMRAFAEDLNRLEISKWANTVVEPQVGYVPPPLEGIWARYPYLHNGSVPTLCDLLSPEKDRTREFYQGPADDPDRDFDIECVGYPVGSAIPEQWKKEEDALIDTSVPGLTNTGHDSMLRDRRTGEMIGEAARIDLIHYLKTL